MQSAVPAPFLHLPPPLPVPLLMHISSFQDMYSLGVLLWEMGSGEVPWAVSRGVAGLGVRG